MFSFLRVVLAWAVLAQGLSGADVQQSPVHNQRLGVVTHFALFQPRWNPVTLIPKINDLGVGWIRDEVPWNTFESKPGTYKIPDQALAWINLAHSQGLKIIIILNQVNVKPGEWIYKDLYDVDAYAKAAAFLAKALKGKVEAIEILNEAQYPMSQYCGGTWNGRESDGSLSPWLKKYLLLLEKSSAAIKSVNPEVKVIGLGNLTVSNFRAIRAGIPSTVDGIVDHPYSFFLVPEQVPWGNSQVFLDRDGFATADENNSFRSMIDLYRKESLEHGGPKELWFTESGFTNFIEGGERKPTYQTCTELSQAKYILRRQLEAFAYGVDVSCNYDFKDSGNNPSEEEDHFGLIDFSDKPKLSYYALRNLCRTTVGLVPTDKIPFTVFPFSARPDIRPYHWADGIDIQTKGDIRALEFVDADHNYVFALWSTERAGTDLGPRVADVEVNLGPKDQQAEIYDLLTGETSPATFSPEGDRLMFRHFIVHDYPVFLRIKTHLPETHPSNKS